MNEKKSSLHKDTSLKFWRIKAKTYYSQQQNCVSSKATHQNQLNLNSLPSSSRPHRFHLDKHVGTLVSCVLRATSVGTLRPPRRRRTPTPSNNGKTSQREKRKFFSLSSSSCVLWNMENFISDGEKEAFPPLLTLEMAHPKNSATSREIFVKSFSFFWCVPLATLMRSCHTSRYDNVFDDCEFVRLSIVELCEGDKTTHRKHIFIRENEIVPLTQYIGEWVRAAADAKLTKKLHHWVQWTFPEIEFQNLSELSLTSSLTLESLSLSAISWCWCDYNKVNSLVSRSFRTCWLT